MTTTVSALRQHTGYEPAMDLSGFEVRASDGRLGRIAERPVADAEVHGGTEPVLVPVGAIVSIDLTDRVVHLDCTKAEVRSVRWGVRSGARYVLREA
ncbi:hypothetical protein [Streptacidiphilus melanogenes]|uniref:hypothetical protein n=1 Tax=Streptacidiphilus melanogenes TaxID=411235 RepID=UPI0005A76113|nr:hypothetical protein [Streptacidiphilus melanogenes]